MDRSGKDILNGLKDHYSKTGDIVAIARTIFSLDGSELNLLYGCFGYAIKKTELTELELDIKTIALTAAMSRQRGENHNTPDEPSLYRLITDRESRARGPDGEGAPIH